MSLTVSILVPIYGVEKYIECCAISLFEQDYPNIEFIFVNDGSPDKSVELLEKLIEQKYSHLRDKIIIINKENEGLPYTRMRAIERATGEYVLNVDSDDLLAHPQVISNLVKRAEESQADLIYFDFYKDYCGLRRRKLSGKDYEHRDKFEFISDLVNYRAPGYLWAKFFKRSIYTDNKLFVPKYSMHEDIVFALQLVYYAKKINYYKEPLYCYRRDNSGSITRGKRRMRRESSAKNHLDLYEFYKDHKDRAMLKDIQYSIFYIAAKFMQQFDYDLLKERPYLKEAILSAPLQFKSRIGILRQLWVKFILRYK